MGNLIFYQLPDETVLKKLESVTNDLPTIGLLEKLDDSDDRFVIRKVEKKDIIKSGDYEYDNHYNEPAYGISDYKYTIQVTCVTVEIDLEWRISQLDKLKERKNITAGIFYFCLTMLLFSFIIGYYNVSNPNNKVVNGFIGIIILSAFLGTPFFGWGLWVISNEKYKFTELKK